MKRQDMPMLGVSAIIVLTIIAYAVWMPVFISDPAQRGQYGDMFGAVSSLFTAFGFAGLLFTIWQQNKEAKARDRQAGEDRKALIKQLQLMEASAILQALPQLIESELTHIEHHHEEQLKDIQETRIRSCTPHHLRAIISQAESFLAAAKKMETAPDTMTHEEASRAWKTGDIHHYRCFVENLQYLLRYKEDLVRLYGQLKR